MTDTLFIPGCSPGEKKPPRVRKRSETESRKLAEVRFEDEQIFELFVEQQFECEDDEMFQVCIN